MKIAQAVLKYASRATELPEISGETCPSQTVGDILETVNDDFVVNEENALRISAVYACIKVISEGVQIAPLHLMEKRGKVRKKATNHPLYRLLHKKPNSYMTPGDFKKIFIYHMCLTGGFYAQKVRTRAGDISQLIPLNPTMVQPYFENGDLLFRYYSTTDGRVYHMTQDDLFHVKMHTLDGFTPVSPIQYQKDALGLAKQTETHGNRYFKNDATPPFAIAIQEELSDDSFERLKQDINRQSSGVNKHKPFLLEGGAKIEKIGLSPEDSQFLETRKYQKEDIASIFKVPPHMIADLSKSSFSNIEQQSLEFVKYTLMPYFIAFEEAANIQLISEKEQNDYYFKFSVDGLLRGEYKTRLEGYNLGRNMGIYSVNDIREMEDMNPIDNGDGYLQPLNFTDLGSNQNDNNTKGGQSA